MSLHKKTLLPVWVAGLCKSKTYVSPYNPIALAFTLMNELTMAAEAADIELWDEIVNIA
jgi:hypothetical protein